MLAHLYQIEAKYSATPLLGQGFNFGMAGVDLFFLISGFIMVYITQGHMLLTEQTSDPKPMGNMTHRTGPKHVLRFLFSRITRIYPLYWVISAALLILYLIRPDMVFSQTKATPNIAKSFLLWPDQTLPLLQLGWTLIHEMGFYLIFALLLFLSPKKRKFGLILWAGLVSLGLSLGWHNLGAVSDIIFHPLTYEFLLGAGIGYIYLTKPNFISPFILLGFGVVLLGVAYLTWAHPMIDLFSNDWARVLRLSGPLGLIMISALYFERGNHQAPAWLVTLGDWSYSLYLTHILTLSVIGRIWARFEQPGLWDNFIVLPLLLIAAIIGAGLTYKIIEAPMIRATKNIQSNLFAP